MPFTLAHPAAVLPLRRYCPRFLNFPALIAGSLVPDLGYGLARWNLVDFSHSFAGSFGFSLPVGLALLWLSCRLCRPAVGLLPERHRRMFLPLCDQPRGPVWIMAASVLIGAWTHLLWDSFTHPHGWAVERVSMLQAAVVSAGGHTLKVCHLLGYVCSFAGVVFLSLAFERWKQDSRGIPVSPRVRLRHALLVGGLVLPIVALHHAMSGFAGLFLVGMSSAVLFIWAALWIGNNPPVSAT
jgi:hypothetical protein